MKFKRSIYCGQLRACHVGQDVTLMGWVRRLRDHGQVIFMDIRDKTGYVQVVFKKNHVICSKSVFSQSNHPEQVSLESVVAIKGSVRKRPPEMISKKTQTGEIEVIGSHYQLLSPAKTPPFLIREEHSTHHLSDELALKYRYLDLRSDRLQKNIQLSHEVYQMVRKELTNHQFVEVATPILYKTTPEGARDYLVPVRKSHGSFYALVQSPQILKQLLMVGGVDRYFQLARCFRDEDLRSDRQPEFTQIDMEMSFADEQDVRDITSQLVQKIWKTFKNQDLKISSMSYDEALQKYGTDRPDLRNPLQLTDLNSLVKDFHLSQLKQIKAKRGIIKILAVPLPKSLQSENLFQKNFSNTQLKKIAKDFQTQGLDLIMWIKNLPKQQWQYSTHFSSEEQTLLKQWFKEAIICSPLDQKLQKIEKKEDPNDLHGIVFILAGDPSKVHSSGYHLITTIGHKLHLIQKTKDRFVWVNNFPLLEYDHVLKKWNTCHHPFTAPIEKDLPLLMKQNLHERPLYAQAYDLVCNGQELASGSVRIHQASVQKALFQALSLTPQQCEEKFGFFLSALQYGTPPHAGIAWGMERLLMLLIGTEHIRDVVAFPKTTSGLCLMSSTPSSVQKELLMELGIYFSDKQRFE